MPVAFSSFTARSISAARATAGCALAWRKAIDEPARCVVDLAERGAASVSALPSPGDNGCGKVVAASGASAVPDWAPVALDGIKGLDKRTLPADTCSAGKFGDAGWRASPDGGVNGDECADDGGWLT
jgi:hypothetical protein